MVDWAAHYDAIYGALGVDAVLTLADTDETEISLTAIDKTAGVVVEEGINVQSVKPGACVRMVELTDNDVTREDLTDAILELNGVTWRVMASHPRPSPAGEAKGEVLMILTATA